MESKLPISCPSCEERGTEGSCYTRDGVLWVCKECGDVFIMKEEKES